MPSIRSPSIDILKFCIQDDSWVRTYDLCMYIRISYLATVARIVRIFSGFISHLHNDISALADPGGI